ncbi:MAG: 3-deoxy-manno-octulosonate cytidylyltransferase [Myxococcota bacterium]|nr:3-deoxy-manno-octulosonate cytidylyltransferase [Myxococcota bacterium]
MKPELQAGHEKHTKDSRFNVVIPARYGSTRLPGKPLRQIAGKTMIERVYEIGLTSGAEQVIVATDDERIHGEVVRFGGNAVMTSPLHPSGTDRIAEVARSLAWSKDTVVVNLQGDEPSLDPALVEMVAQGLHGHSGAGVATLATPILRDEERFDPNAVKVVTDQNGLALYFSRAPIPWVRDEIKKDSLGPPTLNGGTPFLRHIGLYAYRVGVLLDIADADQSPIEAAESLEQLRAMAMGIRIHVSTVQAPPVPGVDTEEDLDRVACLLSTKDKPSRGLPQK